MTGGALPGNLCPVNAEVRICIECGSTVTSITDVSIGCIECGASHRRSAPAHAPEDSGAEISRTECDIGRYGIYRVSPGGP